MAVLFGVSRIKVRNTIALLNDLELVELSLTGVAGKEKLERAEQLGTKLVRYITGRQLQPGFADALLVSESRDEVRVDAKRAPGRHLGIASLLVELGIFHRERLTSPIWQIGERYVEDFVRAVTQTNESQTWGSLDEEELQRNIDQNREAGRAVEEWVVGYEQARLEGHPMLRQIRSIAEDEVDAGFDVASFRDRFSMSHNRLIEVKSFVGAPVFYWTLNEVECARREGDRYALYLVDRAKMASKSYHPRVVVGAYEYFFGAKVLAAGWDIAATEYRLSLQHS